MMVVKRICLTPSSSARLTICCAAGVFGAFDIMNSLPQASMVSRCLGSSGFRPNLFWIRPRSVLRGPSSPWKPMPMVILQACATGLRRVVLGLWALTPRAEQRQEVGDVDCAVAVEVGRPAGSPGAKERQAVD